MIRKREVDDIDRVDTRLLQWHMIVDEGLVGSRHKHLGVTELVGDLPYSLHHLRCLRHRKPFLKELQVLVPDHVEQHRKQRGVSGRHVSGGLRAKAGEKVPQPQRHALRRLLRERLDDHGIRSLTQLRGEPVAHLVMAGRIGNPRAKRHLLLDVRERGLAVELASGLGAVSCPGACLARGEKQDEEVVEDREGWSRYHRSCPTLVESWTKAVITNCEILRFVWRSSLRT